MIFPFLLNSGTMQGLNRGALQEYLSEQRQGKYMLFVERCHPDRSNEQNRYYRVVLKIISEDTGHTPDELHQILGDMFLKEEKYGLGPDWSTTVLSTVEFEEYLESIRRLAAMVLHLYIPDPNEVAK